MATLRARLAALESSGSTRRRPCRRPALAVAAVVAGGLLLAAVGDWYQANREMDQIVSAVEDQQAAFRDLSRQWGALGADGNVGGDQLKQRTVLDGVRPRMLLATRAVEDVTVMPWHQDIRATRDAFQDYFTQNDALLAAMSTGAEWLDSVPLAAAQTQAESYLPEAVPVMPLYDLDARVGHYFAEQEINYSGG